MTDFRFSVAEFLSLGGQENMVLDIEFAADVSSHNVWYPIETVENLASNKLRFGFAPQHNWSQGHIQWEAQDWFSDKSPKISFVVICSRSLIFSFLQNFKTFKVEK